MAGFIQKIKAGWGNWDASRQSINRSTFIVPAARDADKEFTPQNRKTLMKLSRYLRNNLGVSEGLITEISRYSVGTGSNFQADSGDEAWDEQAEEWFREWAKQADISGQFSLDELFDIWCQSELQDGDVFPIKTYDDGFPKIKTIYGHSICGEVEGETGWFDGIKRDPKTGKAIEYLLDEEKKIPANAVIHIMEPRPNVLRGVPKIAHAANNLFDLRDILSFEKQGVKLNSAIAVVLKQAQSNATGNRFAGMGKQSVGGDSILTLEQILGGAQVPRIGPADSVDIHRSDKTSPTFQGFLDWLIRDMAVGFGVPYEFAWNAEKTSGPAQRFVMSKAQRRFDQIQNQYRKYAAQIWVYAIGWAIDKGELPAVPNWYKCKILWPKKATIDFGRESREERENILAGLKTLEESLGEQGKDWREHVRQLEEEQRTLSDLGIVLGSPTQPQNEQEDSQI